MANVLKNCCVLSMLFSIAAFSCTPAQNNYSVLEPDVCIDIEPPRIAPSAVDTLVPPPPPPPPPPPGNKDYLDNFRPYIYLDSVRKESIKMLNSNISKHCHELLVGDATIGLVIYVDGSAELSRDVLFRKGYDSNSEHALRTCVEAYMEEKKPNVGKLDFPSTASGRPTKIQYTMLLKK